MIKMKFYIETYGCQMNVADSELVMTILKQNGFDRAENIETADVILFNTCSVRQHAEERVLGRINNEMRHKSLKDVKIGVIGCMAQRLGTELADLSRGVDFVVGVDQYDKLPEIIRSSFREEFLSYTDVDNEQLYPAIIPQHQDNLKAFITIMRGCNNFCSYCIVPYTRGRERSRSPLEIIEDVKKAGEQGLREIMLLGQNVNSYSYEEINFPQLLRMVNEIPSIKRIRFTTSHPKDLSDELIETMADTDKVCEHFHLAMQSGDNEILKRMNRGYTAEHYYDLTVKLRQAIPEIAITTDVIAGFPGETEEQFQRTYDIMQKIEFDHAYMFKYSSRSGTRAAEFLDQVPEEIRLERLQRLIKQQEVITTRKYKNAIGSVREIYVENISRRSQEEVSGKTRDFKVTVFPGDSQLIGKFVNVKIVEAAGWTLKGKLLK
ncbi:MAG: tRNA (N6-isopentenyl adenosine(37)-C2)-methylthiotransferase MiaB [Candidatus Cloacimonetes bacterium]|nr:tRNA (N6-isopentenyl adenosine(37)-C2)-methylthiotransferase MiaB [Candidatus Cloacimonadota bacterium]